MVGRDVDASEAEGFLQPKLKSSMVDPSTLAEMDQAAGVILDAMEAGKAITVFADYDVDGGASAAQLIRWARALGQDWGLYVPDRLLEGYGPSAEAFTALKGQGQDLIITVDCGAAARLALEAAEELALDVVVVDHHLMQGARPPCRALVNPNQQQDKSGLGYLAAAGVSFLLLVALNRAAKARGRADVPDLLEFIGLSALGTVCDVVPLRGLNRALVSQGIKVLSRRHHSGVAALADVARAGPELSVYDLGFLLGPRINAGGRIGRADMGARLLVTDDRDEAVHLAERLDTVNSERRALQDQILREATEQAQRFDHEELPVLVLADEGWHPGVIGVVAGRLKDRYRKPVILVGGDRDGGGKGSGRSIKGVNLGGAIAAARMEGLLLSGGGHAMAGGLSMKWEELVAFREFLSAALKEDYTAAKASEATHVDLLVAPSAIDLELVNALDQVGPFGAGNPKPTLVMPDVRISYAKRLRGGHARCSFEDDTGARVDAIVFGAEQSGLENIIFAPNPGPVHVLGTAKRDNFRGRERVDFHVKDIALSRGPLSYNGC